MLLRTVGRSVASIVRKRGLVVAAALACAQLWSPGGVKANPATPSSLYASCYPGTYGTQLVPYCYAQWDASPYTTGDRMNFYFGISSTTVGDGDAHDGDAYPVHDRSGSLAIYHRGVAASGSDTFIPWDSEPYCNDYSTDVGYEMGFWVDGDSGTSGTAWCGVIQNT